MDPNVLMFAVLAVMILFMFRNNKKRKKAADQMQSTVVPGAYVMLTSGIFGTIIEADEARVTIESTPGTRLVVSRQAVRQVEAVKPAEVAATSVAKAAVKPAVKAKAKVAAAPKPAAKKPAAKTATKK